MENEDITNHFEWAIMLLKHQFDKDPYSLTTDQIEVLKLHHQIAVRRREGAGGGSQRIAP